jgi:hypothetical protein
MPIRRVKGGFKWGRKGHVYKTKGGALRQMRAIFWRKGKTK